MTKQYNQRSAKQQYQNATNNAQGHLFESAIVAACNTYRDTGRAEINKTPEPFRVLSKSKYGIFTGRFTAHAQPDFQGTLTDGRSIVFEAKTTSSDRMKRDVLTAEQQDALERHTNLGAVAAVCICIDDKFFFIPWTIWRDMKEHYGRKYITANDVEEYRVKFNGTVLFLDYIHKNGGKE
ncbi:Holliday junction resolvase RecU [Anaerotignum sp. MB30-C6]|uniref:Holliday junction resolvase RecU n=1 Tax=Anaerotignum sp. MB30-C6 TaxID=3070814 RepID=UPI0027DCBD48|nr:Holliday junction resolvase RecU [Anaerotignum sp. MB30-C6]WMI81580.1 Holliday junction resolvase RecU [Anaerotignum sp. MB30-C6]